MERILLKIWDILVLLVVLGGLIWAKRHWSLLQRKILENNAMPKEAPRGNVLVLIIVLVAGIIGVHIYLLFS